MARKHGTRPRYITIPYDALVDAKEPKPDVPLAYEFSNGRKFVERKPYG